MALCADFRVMLLWRCACDFVLLIRWSDIIARQAGEDKTRQLQSSAIHVRVCFGRAASWSSMVKVLRWDFSRGGSEYPGCFVATAPLLNQSSQTTLETRPVIDFNEICRQVVVDPDGPTH